RVLEELGPRALAVGPRSGQLLEDATTHGTSPRAVARLRGYLARHRPDAKAADARLALRRLTRHGWSRPAPIKVPRTWALLQLAALSGR
ncbi:MAG TPA: hypothetical protein PKU97_22650, partial [Kofleriaceae bacterium]|nr:hypothetical protein [Kofleriaceae bacterium]